MVWSHFVFGRTTQTPTCEHHFGTTPTFLSLRFTSLNLHFGLMGAFICIFKRIQTHLFLFLPPQTHQQLFRIRRRCFSLHLPSHLWCRLKIKISFFSFWCLLKKMKTSSLQQFYCFTARTHKSYETLQKNWFCIVKSMYSTWTVDERVFIHCLHLWVDSKSWIMNIHTGACRPTLPLRPTSN